MTDIVSAGTGLSQERSQETSQALTPLESQETSQPLTPLESQETSQPPTVFEIPELFRMIVKEVPFEKRGKLRRVSKSLECRYW